MTAKTAIWRKVFLIGFLPSRLTPAKLKTVPHAREATAAPEVAAQCACGAARPASVHRRLAKAEVGAEPDGDRQPEVDKTIDEDHRDGRAGGEPEPREEGDQDALDGAETAGRWRECADHVGHAVGDQYVGNRHPLVERDHHEQETDDVEGPVGAGEAECADVAAAVVVEQTPAVDDAVEPLVELREGDVDAPAAPVEPADRLPRPAAQGARVVEQPEAVRREDQEEQEEECRDVETQAMAQPVSMTMPQST